MTTRAFFGSELAPKSRNFCPYQPTILSRDICRVFCHQLRSVSDEGDGSHASVDPEIGPRYDLRLLLIDHYDSFTYNLADIFAQLCREPPRVVAADAAASWSDLLEATCPATPGSSPSRPYDGIILGPGPGGPSDFPLSLDAIRQQDGSIPILGVCLGHQMLGQVHGATVKLAPTEVHGQVWTVRVGDHESALFDRLPASLPVTRYHSLHVCWDRRDPSIPLVETASTADGVCMALQHLTLPHYGVQFHPESIGTLPHGKTILENFCRICQHHRQARADHPLLQLPRLRPLAKSTNPLEHGSFASSGSCSSNAFNEKQQRSNQHGAANRNGNTVHNDFEVLIHKVRSGAVKNLSPEDLMSSVLSDEPYSFWLDSSNHRHSPNANNRISILGTTSSIGGRRIEYYGEDFPESERGVFLRPSPVAGVATQAEGCDRINTDILTYLDHHLRRSSSDVFMVDEFAGELKTSAMNDEPSLSLPFAFRGGFVGYVGYEVRFDTERYLREEEMGATGVARSRGTTPSGRSRSRALCNPSRIPTAAFLWADRSFVYDHFEQDWYLVGIASKENKSSRDDAFRWMQSTLERLRLMTGRDNFAFRHPHPRVTLPVAFAPNRSRTTYNRNFDTCLGHIRQGESYELCLTNKLEATVGPARELSPLGLYRTLRHRNPAPFSAFFNWNIQANEPVGIDAGRCWGSLAIACSSPERFVSVKRQSTNQRSIDYVVEAKPIKGTCARVMPSNGRSRTLDEEAEDAKRARELQDSIKNRAENLMIVDLLRNDLSRVCQAGTVRVAKLMDIESFATVHQMVSTIRGRLDPSRASPVDVLTACFPGGSMTGAPKLRTMELLDEIEEGVNRGPYSGCLGYISLDGSMDMNIVIRSAVLTRSQDEGAWHVSIGAGGAITSLSDGDDEYSEMMLKASTVMGAVTDWANNLEPDDSARRDRSMNTSTMYTATHNLTHSYYR